MSWKWAAEHSKNTVSAAEVSLSKALTPLQPLEVFLWPADWITTACGDTGASGRSWWILQVALTPKKNKTSSMKLSWLQPVSLQTWARLKSSHFQFLLPLFPSSFLWESASSFVFILFYFLAFSCVFCQLLSFSPAGAFCGFLLTRQKQPFRESLASIHSSKHTLRLADDLQLLPK